MSTPSDSNRPPLPVVSKDPTIPRAALERVLARASELTAEGTDAPDAISESRLMEIGREVGIDTANLRQALAEERARLPLEEPDHGVILDALGPSTLSTQRLVPGTPSEVLAKLDAWMPKMEGLMLRRRVADRVSWEPRHDPLGNFFRSLGMGGRRLDLVRLDQVVASVTAVDATHSVVRFDSEAHAARRAQRTTFAVSALALAFVGLLAAIPLSLFAAPGLVGVGMASIAAFLGGIGWLSWRAIKRGYRQMLSRTHLRLEQLLDELESGKMQPAPNLMKQVTAALLR